TFLSWGSGLFSLFYLIRMERGVLVQLHAVSLGNETASTFVKKALQIYDVVDFIHIRERHWTVKQYVEVIARLQEHDLGLTKLVINDRLDIAAMYHVPNIHLPSHGHDVADVRRYFPHLQIGCSVHSVTEANLQAQNRADYLFFVHVFQTDSKPGLQARGLAQLKQVVDAVSVPVIAIGGITLENIAEVMELGVKGAAVMSGIFAAKDGQKAGLQYRQKLNDRQVDNDGRYE